MFIFAGFPSCAGAGSTHHDVLLLYLLPQTDFFLSLLSYSSSLPSCCVQNNRHIDPLGSHPPFMTSQVPVRVLGHSGAWCRFLVVWFGRFWCAGVVLGLRLRSGVVPGSSTKYETPSDRCALTAATLSYHLAVGIPPWLILSRSFPVVI